MAINDELGRLKEIKHIVVLMMENRSFDHMLGYLRMDGANEQVEGLQDSDDFGDRHPDGAFHRVQPLGDRRIDHKALDPGHGKEDVAIQLDPERGFIASYVQAFERSRDKHPFPVDREFDPTLVLAYQRAENVPVYDFIARNYCVCDHWFSSVPGPTWSNRLYAVTGGESDPIELKLPGELEEHLEGAPIFNRPAFTQWLPDEAWRWYSHDPGTLRLIDSRYRPGGERGASWDDNFAYFDRKTLLEPRTFVDDAHDGQLPAISWIDPNFVDFRLWGPPGSNDDHPPSHVMQGQELVLRVLMAVAHSKESWKQTLLLIIYDEHGGFYDHVPPSDFEVPGDPDASYGVRVPALVVSPYVEAGVSKVVFDHTSIIKTILLSVLDDPDKALEAMGSRTVHAKHLGEVLTNEDPLEPPSTEELSELRNKLAAWRKDAYGRQMIEKPGFAEEVFGEITDLQGEIVGAAHALRKLFDLTPQKP